MAEGRAAVSIRSGRNLTRATHRRRNSRPGRELRRQIPVYKLDLQNVGWMRRILRRGRGSSTLRGFLRAAMSRSQCRRQTVKQQRQLWSSKACPGGGYLICTGRCRQCIDLSCMLTKQGRTLRVALQIEVAAKISN